jgi:hypothetical protein
VKSRSNCENCKTNGKDKEAEEKRENPRMTFSWSKADVD